MKKTLSLLILILVTSFSTIGWCGNIVYPWRSTTAIVKSGDNFEVWFNASSGQTVNSIQLKGSYNTVNVTMSTVTGNWTYDPLSGNTYNKKITVTVPSTTPADRYDLVLNTSSGDQTSYGGVKVIKEYKSDYYIMHWSDGHLYQSGYDSDVLQKRKSAMIDIANIIDAQIIIETGDNMYNVVNHPEREGYYFLGNSSINTKGMAQASAATFLIPGDHEGLNGNDFAQATVAENSNFFNDYWGLQFHCFKYGNGRFMNLNNAWGLSATSNKEHQYEVDNAQTWLNSEGAGGNFFVSSGHCYDRMHSFINAFQPLNLVLDGDKHSSGVDNPWEISVGGPKIAYIVNAIRDFFKFNIYKVNNATGTFTKPAGSTAMVDVLSKGDINIPSGWVSNLILTYSNTNEGLSSTNTATIVNNFNFPITGAKVRFVVPKGYIYSVSKGTKEQEFDGTNVHIVDVMVDLDAKSTTQVDIVTAGTIDLCPDDPNKANPGLCGCGVPEGSCTIPVTGIIVTPASAKLNLHVTKQMSATIQPSTATNKTIIWQIADTTVATVNSMGLVTAVGGGTTTITASAQDGERTSSANITVIPNSTVYQAEDAELSGVLVVNNQPGYDGDGFADFTNPSNDYIKWTVYAPKAGLYTLSFRYALLSGSRPLKLTVNSIDKIASIAFPVTGSWSTWANYTTNQLLVEGNNTITLSAIGSNGGNFDELTISDGPTGLSSLLSNPKTINIYPNPLKDGKLSIDMVGFEEMNRTQFKITNLVGQIVYQEQLKNNTHVELNIPEKLNHAIYIISVESGDSKIIKKLVVN